MLDLVLTPVTDAEIGTPTATVTVAGRPVGHYLAPLPTPLGDTVYFPTGVGSLALATLTRPPLALADQPHALPALDFPTRAELDQAAAFMARLGITVLSFDDQEDTP